MGIRLVAVLLIWCGSVARASDSDRVVTPDEMNRIISRGSVYRPVPNVSSQDVFSRLQGDPQGYVWNQRVDCRWDAQKEVGGHTPKFFCKDRSGRRLKVKYHAIDRLRGIDANNPEVFAGPLATKLYQLLGFYAENEYPVQVFCENCSVDPYTDCRNTRGKVPGCERRPRAGQTPFTATIQNRIGDEEYVVQYQGHSDVTPGFSWEQLRTARGSSAREIDAFRLLAVFVQHGDNANIQQKVTCERNSITSPPTFCAKPILMVGDLGGTFGGAEFFMNFSQWAGLQGKGRDARADQIWVKKDGRCRGNLKGYDSEAYPLISPDGIEFLGGLLRQLTDTQIRDLFQFARVEELAKSDDGIRIGNGTRLVTIDDWVGVFKSKRDQIVNYRAHFQRLGCRDN